MHNRTDSRSNATASELVDVPANNLALVEEENEPVVGEGRCRVASRLSGNRAANASRRLSRR